MGSWTKEPWRNSQGFGYICGAWNPEILREPVVCRAADQYSIDDETFDRIVACVNAMCGIPDPEKFVEAFAVMMDVIRLVRDDFDNNINPHMVYCGQHPYTISRESLNDALELALAAKPTEGGTQ